MTVEDTLTELTEPVCFLRSAYDKRTKEEWANAYDAYKARGVLFVELDDLYRPTTWRLNEKGELELL